MDFSVAVAADRLCWPVEVLDRLLELRMQVWAGTYRSRSTGSGTPSEAATPGPSGTCATGDHRYCQRSGSWMTSIRCTASYAHSGVAERAR